MKTRPSRGRTSDNRQLAVGGLIIVAAVAMLFWWGVHFRVFGSDIDWVKHPEQLGFLTFVVIGAFGAGYQLGGYRPGFKAMAWTIALFVAAIVIGVIKKTT